MSTAKAADLRVRPGTPDDTDRILELVKRSLGEGKIPRQQAYWEWKHHQNPFGTSPVLLAESDGELVGLRVFMRWEWRVGEHTVRAVRAVDTATHPKWQGKGIFKKLTLALVEQIRDEGVAFVFNTPNEQSRPGYLKMGWSAVGRTTVLIRPLRPLHMLRSLLARREDNAPEAQKPTAPQGRHIAEMLQQPGIDALLNKVGRGDRRLFTPRTSEYLRWRYQQIPGFEYRAIWEIDDQDGVAIIYREKTSGRAAELRICEVLTTSTSGCQTVTIGRRLLRSLLRESGADYATGMAARGTPEQRILAGCGFVPAVRLGPILTVRPLTALSNGSDPIQRSAWRVSIGDLELF